MDGRALTRLRIAFVLLGAALLAPLALLARSMEQRLEAQRRLRHEIVAERIFDEMERELTALLEVESARPSEAYSASSTRVEHWAPFVVGYFTLDAAGAHVVAQPQMDQARVERLLLALGPTRPSSTERGDQPQPTAAQAPRAAEAQGFGGLQKQERAVAAPREDKKLSELKEAQPKSEVLADKPLGERAPAAAILKQLNRGGDEREKSQRKLDSKRRAPSSGDDPLADYSSW